MKTQRRLKSYTKKDLHWVEGKERRMKEIRKKE
jgi:hypothetical protein